jgi:short subunit dehydrogenase-like uncharacterized protein
MQNKYGEETKFKYVRSSVMEVKGGFSGGSFATILNLFETFPVQELLASSKPFALSPIGPPANPTIQNSVLFDERLGGWIGPWIMGSTNAAVVRRTYGLLGGKWGDKFSYKEYATYGNWLISHSARLGLAIMPLFLALSPFRWLLRKVAPAAGEGPTKEAMDTGKFTMKIVANTDEDTPKSGSITIYTNQDAAYLLTGITYIWIH